MSEPLFTAVVTDIRLESKAAGRSLWQIALDHSQFTPGDTGAFEAIARSGTRITIPVLRVEVDANGVLWHVVEKPLTEGTHVTATAIHHRSSLLHS